MHDSPPQRFRQPRFSTSSPNENNRPAFSAENDDVPSFARQLASSPTKFSERSVLFLMGNKVPSSVPGRRSSIACSREARSIAPCIALNEDTEDENDCSISCPVIKEDSRGRSQSLKPTRTAYRALSAAKTSFRSLNRL